ALESKSIGPPRVAEAPVSIECRVDRIIPLGEQGGAGNLVLAHVLLLHVQPDRLDAMGQPDPHKLDLVARMGGDWYCHASSKSLFTVPKPSGKPGIGVDALPKRIRTSSILTGNDIGQLGALTDWPDTDFVQQVSSKIKRLTSKGEALDAMALDSLAQQWIREGDIKEALALYLLSTDL
ncbi:MAG: flavin reductase family protein, partial [Saprospiraceae bacterium]|nr:flavin reductase family protein [Saprospiraceae bacterium]